MIIKEFLHPKNETQDVLEALCQFRGSTIQSDTFQDRHMLVSIVSIQTTPGRNLTNKYALFQPYYTSHIGLDWPQLL